MQKQPKTLVERVRESNPRLYNQEMVILSFTEVICDLMARQKIKPKALAKRLGKGTKWMKHFLDGRGKMTLRQVADVFFKLGVEIDVDLECMRTLSDSRRFRGASLKRATPL